MDERQWRLLVRLFSGEASPAEREELRRWMDEDPARASEVASLRALWDATGALPERGNVDAAWARVAERTGARAPESATVHPLPPRRMVAPPRARPTLWGSPALRAAAMVLLLLGAGLLWSPAREAVRDRVLERTVATGKGERVRLTLADGSRVLLGVESRLRYPRWFLGRRRDVHLEGVAYFEVAHDPTRPFRVYTADAVTRVLGTRFMVRDYPGAEPTRVSVTEGRVAVRPAHAAGLAPVAILTRGQALELSPTGAAPVIDRADQKPDLAWTRGTIAFQDAPVPQVVAEIGRWYDVEILVPDSALAARHLTISFENEPLDTLLREIAAALGARIERRGRALVLTSAPPVRRLPPERSAGDGAL